MKSAQLRAGEKPALDLLEEAVHLARRAPLSAWFAYYGGSVPFVLGFLYFWSDMSCGAFAQQHLIGASFLLTLAFIWMKCGQAICAARLRSVLSEEPAPRWTLARLARMALVHAILDPWALIVRPIALLITIPYGWVYAAYQNVVVLGDGETGDPGGVMRESMRQAKLWPRQNHEGMAVLFLAFGPIVWLNVASAMWMTPFLLKSFLGLETVFSKSAWSLVNTTMFVAICAVTYLCVDPLFKAFYVMRCYYGCSLTSGQDLRVELKRLHERAAPAMMAALIVMGTFAGSALAAGESAREPTPIPAVTVAPGSIEPEVLNEKIDEVLKDPRFAWRMPRLAEPEGQHGLIGGFIEGIYRAVANWIRPLKEMFSRWIDEWLSRQSHERPREGSGKWVEVVKVLVYVIGAIVAAIAGWLLWQRWRQGHHSARAMEQPVYAVLDLAAEDLVADQLPEDEWMRLAREMIEKGELRLAFRALYLAGLSHLGHRELITVARSKSNLEYERELRRRGRGHRDVLEAFGQNLAAYERVWYGRHAATREGADRFSANLNRILAC